MRRGSEQVFVIGEEELGLLDDEEPAWLDDERVESGFNAGGAETRRCHSLGESRTGVVVLALEDDDELVASDAPAPSLSAAGAGGRPRPRGRRIESATAGAALLVGVAVVAAVGLDGGEADDSASSTRARPEVGRAGIIAAGPRADNRQASAGSRRQGASGDRGRDNTAREFGDVDEKERRGARGGDRSEPKGAPTLHATPAPAPAEPAVPTPAPAPVAPPAAPAPAAASEPSPPSGGCNPYDPTCGGGGG